MNATEKAIYEMDAKHELVESLLKMGADKVQVHKSYVSISMGYKNRKPLEGFVGPIKLYRDMLFPDKLIGLVVHVHENHGNGTYTVSLDIK